MTTRELTTDVRPVVTAPVTVTPDAITIVVRLPRSWGDAAVATVRLLTGPGARRVAVVALGAATGLGPLGGAALEAAVEMAAGAVTTGRERTVRSGGGDDVAADPGEGDRRRPVGVTRAAGPAAPRGARPRPRPGRSVGAGRRGASRARGKPARSARTAAVSSTRASPDRR